MIEREDRTVARLVGGRYRITGLIASGGMGDVYRAHDEVLDRTVALKVLRSNLGADPDFVERFRREAMNAARLSHPSIVQVYDWGRDDGDAFMAMEFVDGRNLREVLGERGSLDPATVARIAHAVCVALEHARRAGIVHRDIKPENILITADGGVKVADFGLARALAESRATQAGMVLGTAAYLAPEQVQGMPGDHRSDVYALGCMIFEMLTGSPPFTGDTQAAIAYRRVNEDVPSPGDVVPSTPPALDAVVARAAARVAEDRYTTAAEMAAALRAAFPDVGAVPVDLGVHHTTAIPVASQETVVLRRRRTTAEQARARRRRIAVIAAVALVAVTIPLAVRATARITVPSVSTLAPQQAVARLKALGLDPTPSLQPSDTVPEGRIIGTAPPSGARVKRGTAITVLVSTGPAVVPVPDVTSKSFTDAVALLRDKGLNAQKAAEVFDAAKPGTVIKQEPGAQLLVRRGSVVKLTVSKGQELVALPDVRNKTQDDARALLEQAGFVARTVTKQDDKVPEGSVITTAPAPGTKAPKGSTVTMTVSTGTPLVTVPDLTCMTRAQAEDAAKHAGFEIVFEGRKRDNIVVDQDPVPNSKAHKGSTITAIVGFGTRC